MKRLLSLLLIATLALAALPALAGETAQYSDSLYSFSYPSTWKQGVAKDGSIILELPGGSDAVMTFAMATNLVALTGDQAADAPTIEALIAQWGSGSYVLNGEYEMLSVNGFHGFRAFGAWKGAYDLQMDVLSDGAMLIFFLFIGARAIAAQEGVLATVAAAPRDIDGPEKDGYTAWQGAGYSLVYPAHYGILEQTTGIGFLNAQTKTDMILARIYPLDYDYSDALAPAIANAVLPKSTHIEADAQMISVEGRSMAVITGESGSGPVAFYVMGRGRTVLALLFMGAEALTHVDAVLASAAID